MIFHDDKVPVQVIVTLWLRDGADVQEVVSEMDYDFKHADILDMEISDINTEI
jgi:hypothetical protein